MCNTCAKPVHTVSKNRGNEHNLCTDIHTIQNPHVPNPSLSTISTHQNSHLFSTQFRALSNLLNVQFSTLYTGPITRTKIINLK